MGYLLSNPQPILQVFLNRALERGRVGADHLTDLLPILEQQESRHRADAQLLRHVGNVVDVEFVEACVGVQVGKPVPISQELVHRWPSMLKRAMGVIGETE